ncbi:MAG: GNAT family N-acetyltransferase [Arenimonas sp.]
MTTLATTRLVLSPLTLRDDALYCRVYTDPQVMQHVGPALSTESAMIDFEKALRGASQSPPLRHRWVVTERASGDHAGLVGLDYDNSCAEVGALLLGAHQDHGYAAEAIAALADLAFCRLGLTRLHTRHSRINARAAGLMRKLGFVPVGPIAQEEAQQRWQLSAQQWNKSRTRFAPPVQAKQLQSATVPVSLASVPGDEH